jgi:PPOX class probable F420-dependent enzyme
MRRLVDLQYRALERVRHRRAGEVARRPGTSVDFSGLRGARQCLLVTFKRSGEPVPTPVNFGLASDRRLYFRSEPASAKVRRIGNDPRVRVCPCDLRGKPTGAVTEGTARVVEGAEDERADAVLSGNWTPTMKLLERGLDRLPIELVYVKVEVAPAGPGEGGPE